ncbi:MAG TPA: hypothetical protein VIC85_14980 [Ktedonobacterales bacterium]|jgi:hypothetical protein
MHRNPDHAERRQHDAGHEEPVPIVPPIIYTRDGLDPRLFLKPGEVYAPWRANVPRAWVIASYAIIIGVLGLCVLSVIVRLLHG